MKRAWMAAAVLALMALAVGCSSGVDDSLQKAVNTFFEDVKIVDDPLYKEAAMRDDAEPQKAKDYVDAHERLRSVVLEPERKTVILAAFLAAEPTSLRILSARKNGDDRELTVALGPTDEKTAAMTWRKTDGGWRLVDFDGAWQRFAADHPREKDEEKPTSVMPGH